MPRLFSCPARPRPRLLPKHLNKLLARRPDVARAYVLLGTAYLQKGDPAAAAEVYARFEPIQGRGRRAARP